MLWNAFLFARVSWRHVLAFNVLRKICKTKAHVHPVWVDARSPPVRNPQSSTRVEVGAANQYHTTRERSRASLHSS